MKAKITLIATMTYEINPKSYPKECDDYPKMLQLDVEAYQDDPSSFLGFADSIEVKGELLSD